MTQKFTHKSYTLTQTDYNCHFMIFASDGHMVMHAPYDKPLTEEKAREFIEHYIFLAGETEKYLDKSMEDNEEAEI